LQVLTSNLKEQKVSYFCTFLSFTIWKRSSDGSTQAALLDQEEAPKGWTNSAKKGT
jgi:hypothetical protein